jgi:hypothetical protein
LASLQEADSTLHDQVFLSDGINERWIPRELLPQDRQGIVSVQDVHFWVSQHMPALYVSRHGAVVAIWGATTNL